MRASQYTLGQYACYKVFRELRHRLNLYLFCGFLLMARSTPIMAKRKTNSNIVVNVPMLPAKKKSRKKRKTLIEKNYFFLSNYSLWNLLKILFIKIYRIKRFLSRVCTMNMLLKICM